MPISLARYQNLPCRLGHDCRYRLCLTYRRRCSSIRSINHHDDDDDDRDDDEADVVSLDDAYANAALVLFPSRSKPTLP